MECRNCGRALDESANFCPRCGVAREAGCGSCGATLERDDRFCRRCGTAVAAGPASPPTADAVESARERKIATMLFADIAGSTELGERHDPEVVNRLVSELFERLAAEVDRYGGTVEKFAGDAMLAVFGVPAVHEDDPERAVRAALEMQATAPSALGVGNGPRLQLRIGIESGEVLADIGRSVGERDLFVTGDAVNTASRLQAAAAPGTVVVGPTTYASTRDLIEYEELSPRSLKGKELPVASWRAVRVKSRRGGVRAPLGLEAPLIGRDEELGLLKETIRKTVADGRPHLVTVLGDAGVGKTRLVWELEKYLDGLPETFHWRKGRCYSYASLSYSPIVEAVKADARISDDDPPDVVAAKIDARLAELEPSPDAAAVRASIRILVGLADDEQLARDELFEAWRVYLAAIAHRYPLVLVVEDIHWADEVTLDFIEFVARWGDAPITILCVARPELLERRESWSGGIRNAALVELGPLEDAESVRLVAELLDGALPPGVSGRMVELAAGNPLFTEELVRMFVDRGLLRMSEGRWQLVGAVDELSVPGSVQAVLAARLDELPVEEKRLAQEASVVGRIFWDAVVAYVRGRPASEVDSLLRGLRVKELVEPRTPSAMAGAAEWAFHHVLVRDVAYESLPKSDRGALHLAVARWAEQELPERGDELAELIASHVSAALRYAEELAERGRDGDIRELREIALAAGERAARRAASVQDLEAARRWQVFAMDQARHLGRPALTRAGMAEQLHTMVWHETDSAERVRLFGEAVELLGAVADLHGADLELWARMRAAWAQAVYDDGRAEQAQEILEATAAATSHVSPSPARAKVLQTLGWVLWHRFRFDDARPVIEEAIAEAKASEAADVYRWAVHEAGVLTGFQGRSDEALELLRESYRLAVEAGDQTLLSRCYINISSTAINSGYPLDEPLRLLQTGLTRARRSSAFGTIAFIGDNLSAVHWHMGDFEAAGEVATECLEAIRRAGFPDLETTALRTLSDVYFATGRFEEARALVDQALARLTDDRQHYQSLLISQSWRDFSEDPKAAIERLLRPHPDLAGYPNAELQMALWLGRMAVRLGDDGALAQARAVQRRHATVGGPVHRLAERWLTALADMDEAALVEVSAAHDEVDHHVYAAEALCDAALVAARAGDGDDALQRAQAAADRLGYQPLLGTLPEVRWLDRMAARA